MEKNESYFMEKFIHIITKGKKANTYKFALAKSILEFVEQKETLIQENIKNYKDTPIPYSQFANDFFRYYWRMAKFRIPQDTKTKNKEKFRPFPIQYCEELFNDQEHPQPEKFLDIDEKLKQKIVNNIQKMVFNKGQRSHVVPRFQNIVRGNSTDAEIIFYKNEEENKQILVLPEAMEFFIQNRYLLEKFVVLEWAKFCDNLKSPPPPGIISKIEEPDYDRDKSLKPYLKILKPFMKRCFYCNRKLDELKEPERIHVDHFIPRAYVGEDNIWNFVLACSKCNMKKSDSLAKSFKTKFVDTINQNSKEIKDLQDSLMELDQGFGWEQEFDRIYNNCQKYGFMEISKNKIVENEYG